MSKKKTHKIFQYMKYKLIYHYCDTNPFHIVELEWNPEKHSYKQKTVVKYADMHSCFFWFLQNTPNFERLYGDTNHD